MGFSHVSLQRNISEYVVVRCLIAVGFLHLVEQTVDGGDMIHSNWISPMFENRGIHVEKIVGGGDVLDSYWVSLMLVYRGILVEQTVGGDDVLDSYWVSPMLAYRGLLVKQIVGGGDVLDSLGFSHVSLQWNTSGAGRDDMLDN